MNKTKCPICQKQLYATESFSSAVIGIDSEGRYEVDRTHLDCRCEKGLTLFQKENFYNKGRS